MTKLDPVHGFAAETRAGITIMGAGCVRHPGQTTHTDSTTIMGWVESTADGPAVKWGGGQGRHSWRPGS